MSIIIAVWFYADRVAIDVADTGLLHAVGRQNHKGGSVYVLQQLDSAAAGMRHTTAEIDNIADRYLLWVDAEAGYGVVITCHKVIFTCPGVTSITCPGVTTFNAVKPVSRLRQKLKFKLAS